MVSNDYLRNMQKNEILHKQMKRFLRVSFCRQKVMLGFYFKKLLEKLQRKNVVEAANETNLRFRSAVESVVSCTGPCPRVTLPAAAEKNHQQTREPMCHPLVRKEARKWDSGFALQPHRPRSFFPESSQNPTIFYIVSFQLRFDFFFS